MTRLWTIASNAFIETIRRPIFTVLLLGTYLALLICVPLTGYTMHTEGLTAGDNRLLTNYGLSTLLFSGLFIAAFSASSVLAREIEQKTVLTVVTKPVPRSVILVGKYLGVAAAVTVAFYLAGVIFLLAVRHGVMSRATDKRDFVAIISGFSAFVLAMGVGGFCNFFFGWAFSSTKVLASVATFTVALVIVGFVGKDFQLTSFTESFNPQLLIVVTLIWMSVMVIAAVAVAVSTRLGQMATLGVCVGFFLLGLLAEGLFAPHAADNYLALGASKLVPNLGHFFQVDALNMNREITLGYVGSAAAYAACFIAAALLVGVAMLQTREMQTQVDSPAAPAMLHLYAWLMRTAALAGGLAGLALLAGTEMQRENMLLAGYLVGGALIGWLLAGALGRGIRWALYLLVLGTVGSCVAGISVMATKGAWPWNSLVVLIAAVAVACHAAYVLLMCLQRTTRAHFGIQRRKRISAIAT